MAYESTSIKSILDKVHHQHLLLPAIQRNFVWGADRIENYFDSIMRNYPLGNFILWKLDKGLAKKYPFYKFLTHYHERDKTQNEKAQENIYSNDMWGVLDGQQRLSSLYIGISGSLTYKKKGRGHWTHDYNFEEYKLYINLFYNAKKSDEEKEENPKQYDFKFITESNSNEISDKQLWLKVGDIFDCETEEEVKEILSSLKQKVIDLDKLSVLRKHKSREEIILMTSLLLYNKFKEEDLLYYFRVDERELDEVLNIFVRVNNGGLILSKSQLMLATLSGTWAPARDKVVELVNSLRNLGLNIDNDFIMRSALTISDLPVLFKVGTFTTKNVEKVVASWDLVKDSLIRTAVFLKAQSMLHNKFELVSKNAIIPIAYYISKGGNIKSQLAIKNLRKYFVISQVKGIFGSQGDGVLSKIRDSLRNDSLTNYSLKKNSFDYEDLLKISFSGNKSFKIDDEYINELMEVEYGSQAYFILTLLYPNIDYEKNVLDMDHIHPHSKFNRNQLKSFGIVDEEVFKNWYWLGNCLPNLELLTSKVNNNKRAKSLTNYLELIESEQKGTKREFIHDNFLPNTSYEFINFIKFVEMRKKEIIKRLNKVFNE